ncbi:MAG: hypothetical protein PVH41_17280, partial [Anaerolineae bacterium]
MTLKPSAGPILGRTATRRGGGRFVGRRISELRRRVGRPGLRRTLTAFAVYVVATLVLTYPVATRLGSVLAGFEARDGWQYAWWLWFARRLLLHGKGLGNLYLINHPAGLVHPYQWSLVFLSVVGVPLGGLFSPTVVFNILVLSSFVLSGVAAYHLCWELTCDHLAALVGGAIFAFAPSHLGHAMAGWLPQITVYLYPWYALSLARLLGSPTAKRAVGLGLLAGVSALVYVMHIAYFMIPLTLVVVGADLLQRRRSFFSRRRLLCLLLALAICLVLVLPFTLPLVLERSRGESDYIWTHGVVQHSTDLLAFFTPSPFHPLLAPLRLVPRFASRLFEDPEALRWNLAYFGLVPGMLALWGLGLGRPRPWRWLVLVLGAFVLSLGPILLLGGKPVEHVTDGYRAQIVMPYTLVRQIPFLDWGRTPGRLNVVGMLGLGVLAAYGMANLLSRLGASSWKRWTVGGLVVILILFEFLPMWPFPTSDASVPSVMEYIASQPSDGAILHIPMARRRVNHRALFFQTAVDRPIVGGEVLRMLPETPPWWKTLEGLIRADSTPDIVPRPDESERLAWLTHFDVDWVVLHRLEPSDEAKYRPYLERLIGPPRAEDGTLTAFPVPDAPGPVRSPRLYTFEESDWRQPELDGATWRRWMGAEGRLYVYSAEAENGCLRFSVDSHLDFPLLEVYHANRQLDAFFVGDRTTYTTRPLSLTQGMNVFQFRAPEGCPEVLDDPRCWSQALLAPPEGDAVPPCDVRTTCRTFVLDNASFVSASALAAGEAVNVNFGDRMRLRGWASDQRTLRPGDVLTINLTWEATTELNERYVVFMHLLSSDGELVAQHDDAPVGSALPESVWPAGVTFGYPVSLELPDDLSPGDHRILVGVYLWPEIERLQVLSNVPGAETGTIELGSVEIAP